MVHRVKLASLRFVAINEVLLRSAPLRLAPLRLASLRLASLRSAPLRLASRRKSASLRLSQGAARLSLAPLRSGSISRCICLHWFHVSTPCLSISRCSLFAISLPSLNKHQISTLQDYIPY